MLSKQAGILILLPFLLLLVLIQTAVAVPREVLDQALSAYAKAQELTDRDQRREGFQRAERLFQSLVAEVAENPDLYVNLGSAALQAEHLGTAIVSFRRALRLDPTHVRALQNLQHARTLLPAWVPRPTQEGILDTFFFWHHTLSTTARSMTAALSFLLAAVGVACAIYWRSVLARNLVFVPAVVWVGMVVSLWVQSDSPAARQGVIVAEETIARAADSNNAPSSFSQALPGGTEVEILEKRQQWVKIGFANGRNAWVRDTAIEGVDVSL